MTNGPTIGPLFDKCVMACGYAFDRESSLSVTQHGRRRRATIDAYDHSAKRFLASRRNRPTRNCRTIEQSEIDPGWCGGAQHLRDIAGGHGLEIHHSFPCGETIEAERARHRRAAVARDARERDRPASTIAHVTLDLDATAA
jgi:hypothetical protein